jgi:hypothetical protein
MIYHILISMSRTRNPQRVTVTANDEAEAAFLAWQDRGGSGRPWVRVKGDGWEVSDGFRLGKVQVLSKREQ